MLYYVMFMLSRSPGGELAAVRAARRSGARGDEAGPAVLGKRSLSTKCLSIEICSLCVLLVQVIFQVYICLK